MNIAQLVEAVSAGIGASLGVGETMRRYWRRREARQQKDFEAAVSRIVDAKVGQAKRELLAEIRRGRGRNGR